MTAAYSWDRRLFERSGETPTSNETRPARPWFLPGWEELLTLVLLLVALTAVVISIERANWVDEMPSLTAASLIGLTTGWLLARAPLRGAWLHLVGIPAGVVVVFALVLQRMEPANPLIEAGPLDRWSELWSRNQLWFEALRTGGVSNDPLPFVLLVVFAAWALSYIAAWAVFRWHNPWLALVPGGVAMLTNISYLPGQPSAEFIVFLFAAILLFSRMHLRRTVSRWAGERVALPPFLSLEVLHLATWVGLVLIIVAWLIPTGENWGPVSSVWDDALAPVNDRVERVGQVFIGVDSKRDNLIHSFDSALPLQGKVELDDEVLFTVIAPEPLYLRATAFDEYTDAGWRLSSTDRGAPAASSVEAATFGTPDTRAQFRRPVVVEVQVESAPSDRRVLTPGEPLAADRDAELVTGGEAGDVLALRPEDRIRSGDSYAAVGTVSAADVDRLLEAGTAYPDWIVERYLQLPDDLPPEVSELAHEIVSADSRPYIAAVQIESYLRNNYAYSLDVGAPPPREDAVAHFLFDERAGYFDHHASAMAVLLRTLGIPARVAVGYTLDESTFDETTKSYQVTEQQSWTWPEVYFPGLGWVEFNPTPARTTLVRATDDSALEDLLSAAELGTDIDILGEIGILPGQEGFIPLEPEVTAQDPEGGSGFGTAWLPWVLAVAGGLAIVVLAVRTGWEYAFRGLAPATARWAKVQRLASWAGLGAASHRTPLEAAIELRERLDYPDDLRPLARAYTRERYGAAISTSAIPVDAAAEEAMRLDGSYARLRNCLLKRTARRLTGLARSPSRAAGRLADGRTYRAS